MKNLKINKLIISERLSVFGFCKPLSKLKEKSSGRLFRNLIHEPNNLFFQRFAINNLIPLRKEQILQISDHKLDRIQLR